MVREDLKIKNSRLVLNPGGQLIVTRFTQDEENNSDFLDFDVTDQAVGYLYEAIDLAPGVLLCDVFALVAKAPLLKELLHHHQIDKLLEQAANVPRGLTKADFHEAGYVELYWHWHIDEKTGKYFGMECPKYREVGFIESDDCFKSGSEFHYAGERLLCYVGRYRLSTLLNLPLQIKHEVCAGSYMASNRIESLSDTTLGQMLEGLFRELAIHSEGPMDEVPF